MNIGRYQFIVWPHWRFGWAYWTPPYVPIYGNRALWIGALEIRRFTDDYRHL